MVTTLKWTNVSHNEIIEAEYRFEASVFNVEVKQAQQDISKCKFPKAKIWGPDGFIKNAHYGGRAKRNYIDQSSIDAIGFLGSSEMLQIKPNAEKYLSTKQNISAFRITEGTILISRSGTIGNLTFANKTLSKYLVSEHAIRLEPKDYGGYLYAFLRTKTGQLLIKGKIYGAVISQIEPEHIGSIEIPKPTTAIQKSVHEKIVRSFNLRDSSNDYIDEAQALLFKELKLPPLHKIKPQFFSKGQQIQNYSVPLSLIDDRIDGSYHIPIVNSIIDYLLDNSESILPLGNSKLTSKIILPGRFKRHYVEENIGAVFLGGKQIYELDPYNKKYLSIKKHGSRIEQQLFLHENMIAVTCSGTIGRVNLIPKHWENWTMSQHVLRAIPKDKNVAGYLYIWLNSDYGRVLIERFTYGSVIDEIDDSHLAKVPIPILRDKKLMAKINDLALEANKLRTEAYQLEQDAINQVNKEVIFAL